MFSEGNAAHTRDMFSECNAAHPVGCDSPLLTIMAFWQASNLKKSAPNSYFYLQRAVTPDQITQQNSFQKAGGPKAVKTRGGLISRPILDLGFVKSQCHHKIQEGKVYNKTTR
jgi:hypothetical protein